MKKLLELTKDLNSIKIFNKNINSSNNNLNLKIMKGLRKLIRRNLPESWEFVLRKHKMIEKFTEYTYLSLPDYMKGTAKTRSACRNWKLGVNRILFFYKTNVPIYDFFQGQYLNIDNINWEQIWIEIKQYEENCK